MFDLEYEIDKWARQVADQGCFTSGRIDEMKDHIYCEIEKFEESGYSQREAFQRAVSSVGSPDELTGEFSKNRSNPCEHSKNTSVSIKRVLLTTLSSLVLFAGFVFSIRMAVTDEELAKKIISMSFFFWLAFLFLIPGIFRTSAAEIRFFRKLFSR